ncbi:MAG: type I restriction-modification enzyme R subunit C-terminal domain-containing protein, partial [Anaerococcus sp.]|nr:type I restriction-modification enzyme R subunit C-terminal domain-containing protein [Anaerococcus sp.]
LRDESNKDMDEFDLILHLAFDKEPLTRKERADAVKKRDYLSKYEPVAKEVLNALLDKYSDSGIKDLEDIKILANDPFNKYGSPNKIVKQFGGKDAYLKAVQNLSNMIYGVA